jgi:hypothetical protein
MVGTRDDEKNTIKIFRFNHQKEIIIMQRHILIFSFLFTLLFSGCSYFTVSAAMCGKIASEQGEMPQDCRNYSEEEAQKAFDKTKTKSSSSEKEDLKFGKE